MSVATPPLRVVSTVAPLTDITRQVGGALISLRGLVPDGVNAHTFQPTPGDVRYLADADLIILNGLFLEVAIEKLARSSGRPAVTILKLGEQTITRAEWVFDASFPAAQGTPNPHLWLNVGYALTYAGLIGEQLMALDPDNAASYARNTVHYSTQLVHLDRCIADTVDSILPSQRLLLTYHDSWPYFARRYGMRVIGAVQPASFSEPSPREVARLIAQLRQEKVPAIFGSDVFPSRVLEKIAAETGTRYVTSLRDDALPGKPGDREHSYIGMMIENAKTMAAALGGDLTRLVPCASDLYAR